MLCKLHFNNILNSQPILIKFTLKLFVCKCVCFQTHSLLFLRFSLILNVNSFALRKVEILCRVSAFLSAIRLKFISPTLFTVVRFPPNFTGVSIVMSRCLFRFNDFMWSVGP